MITKRLHCVCMCVCYCCFFLARKLSLVGDLPGANVKSYSGYLTVNKKYNSNLFFWFFPALMVGFSFSKPYLFSNQHSHVNVSCAAGEKVTVS